MQWVPLVRSALRMGFPPAVLALELQMCLAPRLLSQMGSSSRAFQPWQSIIQGLRSGTRFGRCLVYYILSHLTTAHTYMSYRIWVDDLTQHLAGTRTIVRGRLFRGLLASCQTLAEHGLQVASKSVIELGVAAVTALKTGRRVLIAMQVNTPLSDSPLSRTRIAVSPRTRIAVSPAS